MHCQYNVQRDRSMAKCVTLRERSAQQTVDSKSRLRPQTVLQKYDQLLSRGAAKCEASSISHAMSVSNAKSRLRDGKSAKILKVVLPQMITYT
uniref:Uncharacterized protein n=1 Tax=Steinernema glaseri TaxID=37863 RepID=A0A1I7Z2R9_9BILA